MRENNEIKNQRENKICEHYLFSGCNNWTRKRNGTTNASQLGLVDDSTKNSSSVETKEQRKLVN